MSIHKIWYRFFAAAVAVMILLSVGLCIGFYLMSQRMEQKRNDALLEFVTGQKVGFVQNVVMNAAMEIDLQRQLIMENASQGQKGIEDFLELIADRGYNSDESMVALCSNIEKSYTTTFVRAYNKRTGRLLAGSRGMEEQEAAFLTLMDFEEYIGEMPVYSIIDFNKTYLIGLGLQKSTLYDITLETMREYAYGRVLRDGSYITIDKILNYTGESDAAVRIVAPFPEKEEGRILGAHNMEYHQYLEKLVQDGEAISYFHAPKTGTGEITQKITYLKLYRDYDWVIGAGIHTDDVALMVETYTEQFHGQWLSMLLMLTVICILYMAIAATALIIMGKSSLLHTNRQFEAVETLSNVDDLTGCLNRRAVGAYLVDYFQEYKQHEVPLCVVMGDVDYFKDVNDTWGHDVGDQVLCSVADILQKGVRYGDKVGRWGGEEFVILIQGRRIKTVMEIAERIRENVENHLIQHEDQKISVTISLGVSEFFLSDTNVADVLKRADKALYSSKDNGRNRVTLYGATFQGP